jgi:protein-tyrosine phosphatase
MNQRKYTIGDVIKEFANDDMATWSDFWARPSLTFVKGELYDPENFDLIPKKHHLEHRLKEKEQQLSNLEGIQKHYEEQHKKIREEIDELKDQINKKEK